MTGCSIVRRGEKFVEAVGHGFAQEYAQRSDPNLFSTDKYGALQQLGEIQRQVENHNVERAVAVERIEREGLDDRAYRAVRTIAQHAAHNAFRASVPETRIVENPFSSSGKRDNLCDLLKPRINVRTSISQDRIIVEPSLRLGFYKVTYTSEQTVDHGISFRYDSWYFSGGIEHDLEGIRNAQAAISYSINDSAGIGIGYSYSPPDHSVSFGFSARF